MYTVMNKITEADKICCLKSTLHCVRL